MSMIVTRQQAADHLRIDDASAEADSLDLMVQAASAVALDYIEMVEADFETEIDSDSDSDWDSDLDTVPVYPYQLQAAVLLLVGDMYRYRDGGSPDYNEATLPAPVRALLYPLKTFGIEL
jgi:hypothetical protein